MSGGMPWALAAAVLALGWSFALTAGRGTRRADVSFPVSLAIERLPFVSGMLRRDRARVRRERCLSQMPALLDVMGLGLSAGLSFDASLELYCSRFRTELAEEMGAAMLRWRCGIATRSEALSELADALGSPPLRRFSDAVTEALAFGTPLAVVLERQAQAIRGEQRALVEERIEKVPVKMLLPLGTLIVPAMLLAILGPLMSSAVGVT